MSFARQHSALLDVPTVTFNELHSELGLYPKRAKWTAQAYTHTHTQKGTYTLLYVA